MIEDLILNGHYEQALQAACELSFKTPAEGRRRLHLQGMALIHLGRLEDAKACLIKAKESFGDNVALMRDLACCYYQTGEISKWRSAYQLFEKNFIEHQTQLNSTTRIQSAVTLAKFFEEEGFIAKAIKLYEDALNHCHSDSLQHLKLLCMPQLLRLKSSFQMTEDVGNFYAELISIKSQGHTLDLTFEIQHSLALAELHLIGPEHAWVRVRHEIKNEPLCDADRRLIYYDFLEELLFAGFPLPAEVKFLRENFKNLDVFESEIDKLCFDSQLKIDLFHLSALASELSLSSYLRILMLYLLREDRPQRRAEFKNKLSLLLNGLDAESRFIWQKRMAPFQESHDSTLQFIEPQRLLTFQSKQLDLSKKKGMAQLLGVLAESGQSSSTDHLIHRLWESKYSPEHFHRLRMTIHRLNQLLFELTAIPKALEITTDQVSLNSNLRLELIS